MKKDLIKRSVSRTISHFQKNSVLIHVNALKRLKDNSLLFQKIYYDLKTIPRCVAIEIISGCNRTCPYCQKCWISTAPEPMLLPTYEKIISDLHDLHFNGTLVFSPWSEPMLDNRLPVLIQKAKSKLPKVHIALVTNGDELSVEKFRSLTEAGADEFDVSDHYSISGNRYVIEEPKQAIETYLKLDTSSREKIHFHDLNYKRIRRIEYFHNRSGTIPLVNTISHKNLFNKCFLPEDSLTINQKGEIVLCVRQWLPSPMYGNVNTTHIKTIWNDPEFQRIRRNLRKGIYDLPVCDKCGFGHLPEPYQIEKMKRAQ